MRQDILYEYQELSDAWNNRSNRLNDDYNMIVVALATIGENSLMITWIV